VQFADFGCPFSAEVSLVERAMAQVHGENVRFIYRNFPIEELHPGAMNAAIAAECAHEQGKFYPMHDALYRRKGDLTEEGLQAAAQEAGVNLAIWERCRTGAVARTKVEQDIADGVAAGVNSTPTFFVNGVKIEGAIPYAIFDSLLAAFRR
jgi:protein-disulfide isomerase